MNERYMLPFSNSQEKYMYDFFLFWRRKKFNHSDDDSWDDWTSRTLIWYILKKKIHTKMNGDYYSFQASRWTVVGIIYTIFPIRVDPRSSSFVHRIPCLHCSMSFTKAQLHKEVINAFEFFNPLGYCSLLEQEIAHNWQLIGRAIFTFFFKINISHRWLFCSL